MAGEPEAARVGLREAVARDREATASKARRDRDLARVRDQPWFEATLTELENEPEPEPDNASAPASAGANANATPLSEAQLAQLRAKLEAKHQVRAPIRASLTQPGSGGETLAWAIYTVGAMDLCRKTESKSACTAKLRGDGDAGDFDKTGCGREFLIRARFGAQLRLDDPVELAVPCKIAALRRFEAVDVDADAAPEIVVDVTGRHVGVGMDHTEIVAGGGEVRILRLDNSTQFELRVAWEVMDVAPGHERSQTFTLVDKNADGHADLLIETMEFVGDIAAVEFDDAMWVSSEPDDEAVGPYAAQLRRYLPDKDEWGPPVDLP